MGRGRGGRGGGKVPLHTDACMQSSSVGSMQDIEVELLPL